MKLAVNRIYQEAFNPIEKNKRYLYLANDCGQFHMICNEDGKIIGYFIISQDSFKSNVMTITRFLIFAKYRKNGIGRCIVESNILSLSGVTEFIVNPIPSAVGFWTRMGFKKSEGNKYIKT